MDNSQILELYKLHVEMIDRVSQKRISQNQFYVTVLTGILGGFALVIDRKMIENSNYIYATTGFIGLTICLLWFVNVRSYKKLNSAKFKVLAEIENKLEFQFYEKEWQIIKKDKSYLKFSTIEQLTPFIFSVPFFVMFVYAISKLLCKT